ncbi:hypothetical protein MPSEU_000117100 [Mayamaea pseudoterrestris]|nr:hypothetical protein MPSEU_000117100 [Mayamaea pseudoterrestris]
MRDRPSVATANTKRSAIKVSASHTNTHSSTLSNNNNDPTMLLARGYISRYLPAKPLSSLQANEIDKDLLHFGAYRNAVISYRQQFYLAVNNNGGLQGGAASSLGPSTLDAYGSSSAAANNVSSSLASATAPNNNNNLQQHHASPSSSLIHSLPVRIDPEEEKRLLALRRKIHRAECLREDLEQQYISLRAHFVHISHVLQTQLEQRSDCVGLLQQTLTKCSRAVGLMRARLQMVRDVHALLTHRLKAISSIGNSSAMDTDTATAAAASANEAAAITDNALYLAWNKVEEGLKQATAKTTTGGSKKQNITWTCTTEPSTPHGVPLLVSSLAHSESAPEKSIAFGTNGAFGANKHSLTWLPSHLPSEDEEEDVADDNENKMELDAAIAAKGLGKDSLAVARRAKLQQEAALLQFELVKEHVGNESLWRKICHTRIKNDEWVAMICLLRQETEAVMLRHAVVMESDEAQAAAERKYLEESERAARLAVEHGENGHAVPGNGAAAAAEDRVDTTSGLGMDDDGVNDGDDEGSKDEEDEIGGEWEGKKRPALEEEAAIAGGGGVASRKKARRNE